MSSAPSPLHSPGGAGLLRRAHARRRRVLDDHDVEVELTPLIDCVFLLLIFFLVTTMMKRMEKQIPVVLPDSTASLAEVARRSTLILGLDPDGAVSLGEGKTAMGETQYRPVANLSAFLAQVARERGTHTPIRLDAHRNTPFQLVIDTLDLCSLQGFERVGVRIRFDGNEYYELGDRRSLVRPFAPVSARGDAAR
jgi:biopolymer transport protein ExbD